MKSNWPKKTTLAIGCFMLAGGLTVTANNSVSAETATPPASHVDPDVLLALVAEVKSLRLELLEHRLETHRQRVAALELELERVAIERSEIDDKHEAMDAEIDEIEYDLQDPDLDGNQRRYLEAMREELDWKRSRTLDRATRTLDTEADKLEARHKKVLDASNLIAAHIQGLIGNVKP